MIFRGIDIEKELRPDMLKLMAFETAMQDGEEGRLRLTILARGLRHKYEKLFVGEFDEEGGLVPNDVIEMRALIEECLEGQDDVPDDISPWKDSLGLDEQWRESLEDTSDSD